MGVALGPGSRGALQRWSASGPRHSSSGCNCTRRGTCTTSCKPRAFPPQQQKILWLAGLGGICQLLLELSPLWGLKAPGKSFMGTVLPRGPGKKFVAMCTSGGPAKYCCTPGMNSVEESDDRATQSQLKRVTCANIPEEHTGHSV